MRVALGGVQIGQCIIEISLRRGLAGTEYADDTNDKKNGFFHGSMFCLYYDVYINQFFKDV